MISLWCEFPLGEVVMALIEMVEHEGLTQQRQQGLMQQPKHNKSALAKTVMCDEVEVVLMACAGGAAW